MSHLQATALQASLTFIIFLNTHERPLFLLQEYVEGLHTIKEANLVMIVSSKCDDDFKLQYLWFFACY